MCPSPRWRLKGDRYLDTVPRLNDWNGMEEALSQARAGHLPFQGDRSWSQGGTESDTFYMMAMTLEVLCLVLYLAT